MAELILKIGSVSDNPATYQDGDIVEAFSDRRIMSQNLQNICNLRNFGFKSNGYRPPSLAQTFLELVMQYKFTRISKREVLRSNLSDQTSEALSSIPNEKNEYIHLDEYLKDKVYVFGSKGTEIWYGGKYDLSQPKLDLVWKEVQKETTLIKKDIQFFPLSATEKKHFGLLSVVDFTDSEAEEYKTPEVDPARDSILQIRQRKIVLEEVAELSTKTIKNMRDMKLEVDNRDNPLINPPIVIKEAQWRM